MAVAQSDSIPRFWELFTPGSLQACQPVPSYQSILASIESQLSRKIINLSKTKQIGDLLYTSLNADVIRLKHVFQMVGDLVGDQEHTNAQMGGGYYTRIRDLETKFQVEASLLTEQYRKYQASQGTQSQKQLSDFLSDCYQSYSLKIEKQLLPEIQALIKQLQSLKTPEVAWPQSITMRRPEMVLGSLPEMIELLSRFRSLLSTQYQYLLSPKHSSEEECKSAVVFLSYLNTLFGQVRNGICDKIKVAQQLEEQEQENGQQIQVRERCLLSNMYIEIRWRKNRLIEMLRNIYIRFVRQGDKDSIIGWPTIDNEEPQQQQQARRPARTPTHTPTPQYPTYQQLQLQSNLLETLMIRLPVIQRMSSSTQQVSGLLWPFLTGSPFSQIPTLPTLNSMQELYEQLGSTIQSEVATVLQQIGRCRVVCFEELAQLQTQVVSTIHQEMDQWSAVGRVIAGLTSLESKIVTVPDRQKRRVGDKLDQFYRQAILIAIFVVEIEVQYKNLLLQIEKCRIMANTSFKPYIEKKLSYCKSVRQVQQQILSQIPPVPPLPPPPPLTPTKSVERLDNGQKTERQSSRSSKASKVERGDRLQGSERSCVSEKIERASQLSGDKSEKSLLHSNSKKSQIIRIEEQVQDEQYEQMLEYAPPHPTSSEQSHQISIFMTQFEQYLECELRQNFTGFELVLAIVQPSIKTKAKLLQAINALKKMHKQLGNTKTSTPKKVSPASLQGYTWNLQSLVHIFTISLQHLDTSLALLCSECLNFEFQDWLAKNSKYRKFIAILQDKLREIQEWQNERVTCFLSPVLRLFREFGSILEIMIDTLLEMGYFYRQTKRVTPAQPHIINVLSAPHLEYLVTVSTFYGKIQQEMQLIDKLTDIAKSARVYVRQLFMAFNREFSRCYGQPNGGSADIIRVMQVCIGFKENETSIRSMLQQEISKSKLSTKQDVTRIVQISHQLLSLESELSLVWSLSDNPSIEHSSIELVQQAVRRCAGTFSLAKAICSAQSTTTPSLEEPEVGLWGKFSRAYLRFVG